MTKQVFVTLLFLMSIVSSSLYAQNANLSIQGVLRNSNGTAVENGYYSMTFNLYNQATGGSPLWSENIDSVQVNGGIYSIILGEDGNLSAAFNETYFLGVKIAGGTELIPRTILTSAPYALSLIGNDNIFPSSGPVGVGDPNPTTKLSVKDGTSTIGLDVDPNGNRATKISANAEGLTFQMDGINTAFIFDVIDGNGDSAEKMRIETNGKVGIGTDDPQTNLHLIGTSGQEFRIDSEDNVAVRFLRGDQTSGASLGFENSNSDALLLENTNGPTLIKGTNLKLTPAAGNNTAIDSDLMVTGELKVQDDGELLKLNGSTHSYIGLYPTDDTRKALMGFDSGDNEDFKIENESEAGNVYLGSSGGRVIVTDQLEVTGGENISTAYNLWRFAGGGVHNNTPNPWSRKYSISTPHHLKASGYWVFSDRRIKKDIVLSEAKSDLATLNKIEVTDYKYIDPTKNGNLFKKGVIAQQVESVYPQAITLTTDFIPNLLTLPNAIDKTTTQQKITLDKPHQLEVGDQIKCYHDDKSFEITVRTVFDEQTFAIDNSQVIDEEVLFYGKKIADFHNVDNDQIFTLAISAVQELSRKVEALEKENHTLKSSTAKANHLNTSLSVEILDLNHRIDKIENLLNATVSKE